MFYKLKSIIVFLRFISHILLLRNFVNTSYSKELLDLGSVAKEILYEVIHGSSNTLTVFGVLQNTTIFPSLLNQYADMNYFSIKEKNFSKYTV